MTINDLIEQLQRLPMKDRPIYIERFERGGFNANPRLDTPSHCSLSAAVDEGPYVVIRPIDKWIARD